VVFIGVVLFSGWHAARKAAPTSAITPRLKILFGLLSAMFFIVFPF
jgi:hypothetical protein